MKYYKNVYDLGLEAWFGESVTTKSSVQLVPNMVWKRPKSVEPFKSITSSKIAHSAAVFVRKDCPKKENW